MNKRGNKSGQGVHMRGGGVPIGTRVAFALALCAAVAAAGTVGRPAAAPAARAQGSYERPTRAADGFHRALVREFRRMADSVDIFLPLQLVNMSARGLPRPVPLPTRRPATATRTTVPATATDTPEPLPTETETPSPTPTRAGYNEPLTDFADLADLRDGYQASRWYETMLEILARRYRTGNYIVTHLASSKQNAATWVGSRTGTFDQLVGALDLTVHEMNHQLGIQEGWGKTGGQDYTYIVRDDLSVTVTNHKTFARSEIGRYITGPLENMYKGTYLTGSSGKQGFTNLLDELNAYTHSLFTAYGVHDLQPPGQRATHRDGLVTFMMYTQFYLRVAREKHADDYTTLKGDREMRALVKLLWERANFILDTTQSIGNLSMNPEAIEAEMRKADMQAEIEMFLQP
jgi:hypothetical protein